MVELVPRESERSHVRFGPRLLPEERCDVKPTGPESERRPDETPSEIVCFNLQRGRSWREKGGEGRGAWRQGQQQVIDGLNA